MNEHPLMATLFVDTLKMSKEEDVEVMKGSFEAALIGKLLDYYECELDGEITPDNKATFNSDIERMSQVLEEIVNF